MSCRLVQWNLGFEEAGSAYVVVHNSFPDGLSEDFAIVLFPDPGAPDIWIKKAG